jgi:hypothetical protein
LEEDIQGDVGIKVQDVVFYGGFFTKIDDKEHRTDLNPVKGGKEGLEFLELLEPDEYIHPILRGKDDKTYTDAQGRVQGYENTKEGLEVFVTDPKLAAEKNMGIWSRAFHRKQEKERPRVKKTLTDMILEIPKVSATIDGKIVEADLQPKNRLFGRRTVNDKGEETVTDSNGEQTVVDAEEVKRASVQPIVNAMCHVLEGATHNIITDRTVCAIETIQNHLALLEDKVNIIAAQSNLGMKNRPTKKELNVVIQSERQARFNVVVKIDRDKLNQLKETSSMEGWKAVVIGWFHEVNTSSFYQSIKTEYLRFVGFSRNPRNEDMVPVILTWDTEDRARTVLEEYRRIEEEFAKRKTVYKGSDLEEVDQKLGKIIAFKSKREQMQDDEFYEMTRNTNNMNIKVLKNLGDRNFEDTRRRISRGEWKEMPQKIYTTKRGNDSKGPNTLLQEYKYFKAPRGGDREKEWMTMVQNQMKYVEAGLKRGTVRGENQETIDWLPQPANNKKNRN